MTHESVAGVVYRAPTQLNLQSEESNVLDLDSQQLVASGMALGTSELLNSVRDNKLSQELHQGLQINDPAAEPGSVRCTEMTDSLKELTRDIGSLNEMYKPNLN